MPTIGEEKYSDDNRPRSKCCCLSHLLACHRDLRLMIFMWLLVFACTPAQKSSSSSPQKPSQRNLPGFQFEISEACRKRMPCTDPKSRDSADPLVADPTPLRRRDLTIGALLLRFLDRKDRPPGRDVEAFLMAPQV